MCELQQSGVLRRSLGSIGPADGPIVTGAGISLDSLDGSTPTELGEALTRAKRLVSDQVGLISEVVFREIGPDEPAVYWVHSTPAEFGPLAGHSALNVGTATSVDPDRAIIKAVGESIERYCCAFYGEDELVLGTFNGLAGDAAPPERYALF